MDQPSRTIADVDTLPDAELEAALGIVLAAPDATRPLSRRQAAGFRAAVSECGIALTCLGRRAAGGWSGLSATLLLPGATAILMLPTPGRLGMTAAAMKTVVAAGLDRLAARRLHFAQALLEPEAVTKAELVTALGFSRLSTLVYLECTARGVARRVPMPPGARWVSYSRNTHPLFSAALEASYAESLDCPELSALRPVEDVLASHRAAGPFDPALWQVLMIDDRCAGCALLSRTPARSALEVVYVGVAADFRRSGIGSVLMSRAFVQARDIGAEAITLAVDERNEPARRLYARFGMIEVRRRVAYVYRWRTG
ncbi:MAG: GNAT family N-acetyltransferase [Phycisphaerae bacterium]